MAFSPALVGPPTHFHSSFSLDHLSRSHLMAEPMAHFAVGSVHLTNESGTPVSTPVWARITAWRTVRGNIEGN